MPRPLFSSLFSGQPPRMDDEPRTLIFLSSLNLSSHEIPLSFPTGSTYHGRKVSTKKISCLLSATSSCTAVCFLKKECCNKMCEPLHCESFSLSNFLQVLPNHRWNGDISSHNLHVLLLPHSRFRYQIPCTCFPCFFALNISRAFHANASREFLPCTLCYNSSYLSGRIVTPTTPGVNKNPIANRSNTTSICASRIDPRKSNRLFSRYDQRPRLAPCIE